MSPDERLDERMPERTLRRLIDARRAAATVCATLALAACALPEAPSPSPPSGPPDGRALVRALVPESAADRAGWAVDIHTALVALDIAPTVDNVCAVVAVIAQESGFRADPAVPGLAKIARREIEVRRERAGVPQVALDAALALTSSDGRSFRARIDAVRTERELSEVYEDFIRRVPFGNTLLAHRNPVRTGGPMQVSVAFAEAQVEARPYPYADHDTIRHEVFTRRGGVYFGVAHLLDYPAQYDRWIYRFADYNAGHYASRNAAFQAAVSALSGEPLAADGDLLVYDGDAPAAAPSRTELAVRKLGTALRMSDTDIRRDLAQGEAAAFDGTVLYARVYALADRGAHGRAPRAKLPEIALKGPKITRELTTAWFAQQVERRFDACRAKASATTQSSASRR